MIARKLAMREQDTLKASRGVEIVAKARQTARHNSSEFPHGNAIEQREASPYREATDWPRSARNSLRASNLAETVMAPGGLTD